MYVSSFAFDVISNFSFLMFLPSNNFQNSPVKGVRRRQKSKHPPLFTFGFWLFQTTDPSSKIFHDILLGKARLRFMVVELQASQLTIVIKNEIM